MIARAAVAALLATAMQLSHSSAVDLITAAGLTWSSTGNCDDRNNPECTSFDGIRQTTIDGIITLKTASGCLVNITGGTETGHGSGGMYTHWDGWKIDISKGDCINSYIHTGFRSLGYISGWGYQYKSPAGNLYTDEGDHWDILYYNCGGCEPDPTPPAPTTPPASPSITPPPSAAPALTPSAAPALTPSTGPAKKTFRYKG